MTALEFIEANYLTMPLKQMAKALGRSQTFVAVRMRKIGLVVPEDVKRAFVLQSQFKKGHATYNKGKKLANILPPATLARLTKTSFKPNHKPANTKEIGTVNIRIHKRTGTPYKYIKLADCKWELLHRYNWRMAHGDIPHGVNVQFKDGDTLNCNLDNLYIIHRQDQARVNHQGGAALPLELRETIQIYTQIKRKIKQHEKQDH